MKLIENPSLPQDHNPQRLQQTLYTYLRSIAIKVNLLATGMYAGFDGQATSAPSTGTWTQGDFVKNSNPTELGSAGSKYVLQGWICVTAGTPGTWKECRTLTGN